MGSRASIDRYTAYLDNVDYIVDGKVKSGEKQIFGLGGGISCLSATNVAE